MDEVGRGTTVTDGIAIAFATVHHLYNVNRCRALFATHFHEIADMLGYADAEDRTVDDRDRTRAFASVGFFCTDVDETGVRPFLPSVLPMGPSSLTSLIHISRIPHSRISHRTAPSRTPTGCGRA